MTETTDRLSASGEGAVGGDGSADDDVPTTEAPAPPRGSTALFVAGLVALAGGIPLAIALAVLRQPRWYPVLDLAQTELRLRDFTQGEPPLVGLAGRITGADGEKGSHPGPLSFWALWPFYKLFGSTGAAMQAAAVSLNLIAMGVSVWIANRRGGRNAALVCALALAVLVRSYGADRLSEAWNPYMPILWWVVLLLAVWSVLCDDWPMLPVAVFAGSFCMQTHIPYSGLVLGMWAVTIGAVALGMRRRNRDLLRWGGGALALLVVLWIPPLIDELTNDPGNLTLIKETFQHPREDAVGFGDTSLRVWLSHLDPFFLLTKQNATTDEAIAGSVIPGLVLLAVWIGAVVVAWRAGRRDQLRLHLATGAALVLGFVSISRILGTVWGYLVLWAWATTMLMVVATLWSYTAAWRNGPWRDRPRLVPAALIGALVGTCVWFSVDAARTEVPAEIESRSLRNVVPQVVGVLDQDGRYLLEWNGDEMSIGSQGFGFLLALEQAGFDVGVYPVHGTGAVDHRVLDPEEATAEIHYVVGETGIERWRGVTGATELGFYEPRDADDRARFDELHDKVTAALQDLDHEDLVERLDLNLFTTAVDPRTPEPVLRDIQEMMRLGLPSAVFVAPVGVAP